MSRLDELTLTNDPAWPWSLPNAGLVALAVVALLLTLLTVWTYLGVPGASGRRVSVVLGLRLAALVLACLAILRPSLTFRDELRPPSLLFIAADYSESMAIQDESGKSRWQQLLRTLESCEPILQRLREEHNVNVQMVRFAEDVSDFEPQGSADGKRTDFGRLLESLYDRPRNEPYLRGLLILSDGADNGPNPALPRVAPWRALPCPVHTFGFGKTTTTGRQSDIAVVAIRPEPSPVFVKGELTVKGIIDAHGYAGATVRVHLLIDDKEVLAEDKTLMLATGNEVSLKTTAPAQAGEVKVTLRVAVQPDEVSDKNNEIGTYLTVTKEGLSVLLIDTPRFPEPQLICDALRLDRRIRLYTAWLRGNQALAPDEKDLFQFNRQRYDVIILGDVTAEQLNRADPKAMTRIRELVRDKSTGFLMMGGDDSFGPSWQGTPIAELLPVEVPAPGRTEGEVRVQPKDEGLRHYLMQLTDQKGDKAASWKELRPLDGMTRLGKTKTLATVYAEANKVPVLVGQDFGSGRTLAFAGDTTFRWRRTAEGVESHARFWKQVVLWLARQEKIEGNVWVEPETRRLASGKGLGFGVGLRGLAGADVKEARFEAKVIDPNNAEIPVPTGRTATGERGTVWKTDAPGEYRLVVRGQGKDEDGQEIRGEATARFLVYQDDAEMTRRAADHDFLRKLAAAGGGRFHEAKDLARFLQELAQQPPQYSRPKAALWPDWRRNALSGFLVLFFVGFVALLGLEWYLRRRWGMV